MPMTVIPLEMLPLHTARAAARPFRWRTYLRQGWKLYARYPVAFGFFTLLLGLKMAAVAMLADVHPVFMVYSYVDSFVIDPVLFAGYMLVAHAIARGELFGFGVFFAGFGRISRLFGVQLGKVPWLYIGLWVFVLPVVYVVAVLLLAKPIVLFYHCDSPQALQASFRILRRKWPAVLLFMAFLGVILVFGTLFIGIGLLVAMPWVYCSLYAAFHDQCLVADSPAPAQPGPPTEPNPPAQSFATV
jgi:hypothetical protein